MEKSISTYNSSLVSRRGKRLSIEPPSIKIEVLDNKKKNEISQMKFNRNILKLEPIHFIKINGFNDAHDIEEITEPNSADNYNRGISGKSRLQLAEDTELDKFLTSESQQSSLSPKKSRLSNRTPRIPIKALPSINSSKRDESIYQIKTSVDSPSSAATADIMHIPTIHRSVSNISINKRLLYDPKETKHSDDETQSPIRVKKYAKQQSEKTLSDKLSNDKLTTEKLISDKMISSQKYKSHNQENSLRKHPFRHLIFSPKISEALFQKHLTLIIKGLAYSTKYLKGPSSEYLESRQIMLKSISDSAKKTLVLDLDETLISCCSFTDNPDRILQQYSESGLQQMAIKIRPYAKEFLKKVKNYFEVIIFTASSASYADIVVKELDPSQSIISYILDRKFCLETRNGFFIKDLRIIKNRDLKNMVIVDNLVHSFGLQLSNGIPILEWREDKNDQELKYLENYLIELSLCDDIPSYNSQKLRLLDLLKMEDLAQSPGV